ncbi:PREDICTED: spermidine coumaroyl-CoA acyltransferase-like [Camelina sativa]|uniref:Spermidine coumaroyl-CoA acyltransferase-like n=1 Tax=Camelina sativa TaxID=90675 RepID=A0ABM0WZ43_CAMSA|nr:PREDICTED: spermidine coumaroyl-CoA acyltransferase-like [Camelina sativa]XP_010478247.1 PREDICTED: spermidine coumaroyl-CoA acyltransferase-like [Camelina sativa]
MATLEITETTLVQPSHQPLPNDQTLSLSHLDNDNNLHVSFRYLRVYSSSSSSTVVGKSPSAVVSASLATALVHYYPLAGTLRRSASDDRFELYCTAGQSVPIVNATVNCTLESVGHLDGPDPGFVERLVPDPTREEGMVNPCILQVTMFQCGGWVLGAAIHHAICDGLGASLFFNAMAEIARGATKISIEPVWDRARLLGPREKPWVGAPVRDFLSLDKDFDPYGQAIGDVKRECFFVTDESLDRFKAQLLEKSGLNFTTFEALGAYIWRAKVRATKTGGDENVKYVYAINIRRLMNPPLLKGYWGNGCVPMYAQIKAGELIEQPIWKTAELIKQSKSNASDEYVRSFIDFQELHHKDGINAGSGVTGFTDWRYLGHSTIDFGWGGPVTVLPLSNKLLGSMEPCFFLPYSADAAAGSKDSGFKVLVNLRESAMPEFKEAMDRFHKGEIALS